jgi:hypothetical protein
VSGKVPNSGWVFLLLVLMALAVGGCASTESENLSERPWNSPQSWEGGMGGMLNRYR